jgi:hypothetical protein
VPQSTETDAAFALHQARIANALLTRRDGAPEGFAPADRFCVYRNNVLASLTAAIRARYPAVERLVGKDFFQGTANLFVRACPPSTPVLIFYGEGFAAFLEDFEPARELPYLSDVARLEWLRHTAYHAQDRKALTAESLAEVLSDRAGDLVFEPHPSAGLFCSTYPAVSIWETNIYDEQVRHIEPDLPGEAALIVRPEQEVRLIRLDPAEHRFCQTLWAGETLAQAAHGAGASGEFQLATCLGKLIAAGAFCAFTLNSNQSGGFHHA